jgi:alpha-L-fucosidase 2
MNIWPSVFILAAVSMPLFATEKNFAPETTILFDAPATNFTESTPLGNGRLGAMMFGGVSDERIVLNESSVWSGSHQEADRPEAYKVLPEIRKLLIEGKNAEAEALMNANFTCKGPGSANGTGASQYGCYQVLGNLHLSFSSDTNALFENYRRELNLDDAVAHMEFTRGGVTFKREMFASAPNQVMVLRLTASESNQISFDAP